MDIDETNNELFFEEGNDQGDESSIGFEFTAHAGGVEEPTPELVTMLGLCNIGTHFWWSIQPICRIE